MEHPYYLFLSVDTDGVGTFVPFTQRVVRVAFVVTTPENSSVLRREDYFVQGAEECKTCYTLDQMAGGVTPEEALARLLSQLQLILANRGRMVVHNKNFICSALKSLGCTAATVKQCRDAMYCTMENAAVLGPRLKYPKLVELCTFLLPLLSLTASQLEQCSDKVVLLMQCYTRGKQIMLFT